MLTLLSRYYYTTYQAYSAAWGPVLNEVGRRLHRVVKDTAPNEPIPARRVVMLAPGDIWNFRAAFLTGARPLPVFLAKHGIDVWGIDVWGIDYRWTFVPASMTELSFMKDWGLDHDARDLAVAIGVARIARGLTGSGFGTIFCSAGGAAGTSASPTSTTRPGSRRPAAKTPPDQRLADYGHADLFLANDAHALVWQALLDWLRAH